MTDKVQQYRKVFPSGTEEMWRNVPNDGIIGIGGGAVVQLRDKPEQCTALTPFDVDGIKLRCEKEAHGWGDKHRHDFEFSEHHVIDYDDNDCSHTIEW